MVELSMWNSTARYPAFDKNKGVYLCRIRERHRRNSKVLREQPHSSLGILNNCRSGCKIGRPIAQDDS